MTEKRANKHAPIEMSSKKPVPKAALVIEPEKVQKTRDPRFSASAGSLSMETFQRDYGFLEEMRKSELDTLKANLKRARKMLRSSPRDQHSDWETEIDRLERAAKRHESLVDRDVKESVERSTLRKALEDEKRKRKEGKGVWYMKKSEKKQLLLRARYDALAKKGGRGAVRKAIEKKQKKMTQREKRRGPFAANN